MNWPHFIVPSYVSQSSIASGQDLVNFYVEKIDADGALGPYAYYPTPGMTAFVDGIADSPGRAIFAEGTQMWAVIGLGFYEIFETGIAVLRGAVASNANPATISSNGAGQLFITSGDKGYCYDTTTHVLTVVLAAGATMGCSLNGYFISFNVANGQFRISSLLNGLVWDPTQFAQRSLASDPWVSMLAVNGRLYLFGSKTSEVWYNNGGFPFPFAPITTNIIQYGIAAPFARSGLQDTAAWLAKSDAGSGLILQTKGITPEEIQTEGVSWALSRYTTVTDAIAWGYADQGKPFALFDFPSAKATWAVDGKTGFWGKRGTWDVAAGAYTAWRPAGHAYQWDKHFVIDRESGVIYRMDISLGLDAGGGPIRRLFRPGGLFLENAFISVPRLELVLDTDPVPEVGQGSDPEVLMRFSKNGGKTYGNWRTRKAGKTGDFGHRVVWNRCGRGRRPQPEFVVSDPVPWRILAGLARVTVSKAARAA